MRSLLVSASILLFILGCSFKPTEVARITIKGSDSMFQLTELLAEEYMKLYPGISVYVSGGGTAVGIKAMINGEVDICTASRDLKPVEAKSLADYYGTVGLFYLVAKDALCIYVNPSNPVRNLTLDELRNIYECKTVNWKELNGKNQKIIPVIRNINSGTHLYFRDHILLGEEYCSDAEVKPTTPDIIKYVEANENAIGYGSIGYKGKVTTLNIEGIEPSAQNAWNDSYPITRYLHFFTSRTPKGAVKNFIDWVLSPVGQKVIKQSGFIPLWEVPPQ
ncbi:MAG: phosphate ABC transporter substrate-binding protein [Ignavibacteriaceae bacterium]|nr:phosphate ABC transporter substrate-binding protein [Ignavibacteriaceae bacterium]